MTITQFQQLALDRLDVLKHIEELKVKGVKGGEYAEAVAARLRDRGLEMRFLHPKNAAAMAVEEGEARRRDQESHFVLRLAYCGTEENRRWFRDHESALFRVRLETLLRNEAARKDIGNSLLHHHQLRFDSVSEDEFRELREKLFRVQQANSTGGGSPQALQREDYVKVPFEDALELVRNRRVLLHLGEAFVPQEMILPVLVGRFRAHLSRCLVVAHKASPQIRDDERVRGLLKNISSVYTGPDFSKGGAHGAVDPSQLDAISRQSYPLCMKHMHDQLRADHHLKYSGRVTYGLFLKGIGLSLEHALAFWKSELSKSHVGPEKFDKEYAYGVRFNYGKEGKRTNYTPWGCSKIIAANPGLGEHHGCPYKVFDADRLRALLGRVGVQGADASTVVDMAKIGHYQVACRKVFEITHGVAADKAGQHPNSYYDESVAVLKARQGKAGNFVPSSQQVGSAGGSSDPSQDNNNNNNNNNSDPARMEVDDEAEARAQLHLA